MENSYEKSLRFVVSLITIICISFAPLNAFATYNGKSNIIIPQSIELSLDQLSDGVTILITRNDDGTYSQAVYDSLESIPALTKTADGTLDWAAFHLGFKDWTNYSNELYFSVSSDEPMDRITGKAYVRSTSNSWKYYYNESFDEKLYSSFNTGRQLSSGVDTQGATTVRVGFKNVILRVISGDYGVFDNNYEDVERP